jgi:hypothetical protein
MSRIVVAKLPTAGQSKEAIPKSSNCSRSTRPRNSCTTDITFTWDTTNTSIGKHTLKVEIPPVPGEQNTEDNIKTVTIEVKEPSK